jgi:hypothetical protein
VGSTSHLQGDAGHRGDGARDRSASRRRIPPTPTPPLPLLCRARTGISAAARELRSACPNLAGGVGRHVAALSAGAVTGGEHAVAGRDAALPWIRRGPAAAKSRRGRERVGRGVQRAVVGNLGCSVPRDAHAGGIAVFCSRRCDSRWSCYSAAHVCKMHAAPAGASPGDSLRAPDEQGTDRILSAPTAGIPGGCLKISI